MPTSIIDIPVTNLHYDPQNPRLPSSVDGTDEIQVITWMLKNENLIELMLSIAEKGYFVAEPIWVVPREGQPEHFIVAEGNRRLTAVKLLLNPSLATLRSSSVSTIVESAVATIPTTLPAIVFPNLEQVTQYLGYRHITGVEQWDALAKARYLRRLQSTMNQLPRSQQYASLAKSIGSKANFVKKILLGLDVYEKIHEEGYFSIPNLSELTIQFGVLYTALDNPKISNFIGVDENIEAPTENLDVDRLGELTSWMFEKHSQGTTRLGESRNIKHLAKVIDSPIALRAFRDGLPLSQAKDLTTAPHELFTDSLTSATGMLSVAQSQTHLLRDIQDVDVNQAYDVQSLARNVYIAIRDRRDQQNLEND